MKQQAERPKAAELRERGGYSVVDGSALAAMLPRWQGVTRPRPGPQAVLEAVVRLRGAALPFSALERDILSARVLEYAPEYLDRLCADGIITWQGCERIGERDGRVVLYLRGDMPALGRIRVPEAGKPAAAIRDLLARQGGMLFAEITATLGGFPPDLRGLFGTDRRAAKRCRRCAHCAASVAGAGLTGPDHGPVASPQRDPTGAGP
jgi:ATP-dependent Lhr-like helicase